VAFAAAAAPALDVSLTPPPTKAGLRLPRAEGPRAGEERDA
jgi:hypothetical protein